MFSPVTKLVFVVSVLFLAPLSLLSWVNYNTASQASRQEIVESALPLTRDNIYSEIHSDLIEPINVSSTMANDAFLKAWVMEGEADQEQVVRFLSTIQRKYGYFSVFFISARTNRYYHYNRGLHKVISEENDHDQWYYDFLKQDVEYDLDVDTDEASNNTLTIFINFRVVNLEGELLGVTGVGMKMEKVAELLHNTGEKFGRKVYLIDHDGNIQAHVDQSLVINANIRNKEGMSEITDSILNISDQPANFEFETSKSNILLTVRYIPELDWYLLVEQDEDSILASARNNFFRTLGVGIALWLIAVALTIVMTRRHYGQLESLARTDPLTGLANRRLFIEQFQAAASRQERSGVKHSLILMDLDGFKQVNDTLGHIVGDKVLLQVVQSMKESVRPMDVLARWGGDEFIILAEANADEAVTIADRIRGSLKSAMHQTAGDDPTSALRKLTVSCGIIEYDNNRDLDDLVQQADTLLYSCKEKGGDIVISQ